METQKNDLVPAFDGCDEENEVALVEDLVGLAEKRVKQIKKEKQREDDEAERERIERESMSAEDGEENTDEAEKPFEKTKQKGRPKKEEEEPGREQRSFTLSPLELQKGIQEVRMALQVTYKKEVNYLEAHWPRTRMRCIKDRMNADGTLDPCELIRCKHHLLVDVNPVTGALKINFPEVFLENGEVDLSMMPATCVLDVAEKGGITLEETGKYIGLTRERVRQAEDKAKAALVTSGLAPALFNVHYGLDKDFRSEKRLVAGLSEIRLSKAEAAPIVFRKRAPEKPVEIKVMTVDSSKAVAVNSANAPVVEDVQSDDFALDFTLKDDF